MGLREVVGERLIKTGDDLALQPRLADAEGVTTFMGDVLIFTGSVASYIGERLLGKPHTPENPLQ